jgi:hypothetical protein
MKTLTAMLGIGLFLLAAVAAIMGISNTPNISDFKSADYTLVFILSTFWSFLLIAISRD